MVNPRHFAETLCGINQHRLGCLEALALLQNKLEIGRINTDIGSCAVICVFLRSRSKVTAVNKVEAVNATVIFGCVFIAKSNKRIVHRTAATVAAVYSLITVNNSLSCNVPFPCPSTVKVEYFLLGTAVKIHRRTHCRVKEHSLSPIYNPCTAGYSVQILKYRIGKENIYILQSIFKVDCKGLNIIAILAVGSGKTL